MQERICSNCAGLATTPLTTPRKADGSIAMDLFRPSTWTEGPTEQEEADETVVAMYKCVKRSQVKVMNIPFKMMTVAFKMMNFAFKMMSFEGWF